MAPALPALLALDILTEGLSHLADVEYVFLDGRRVAYLDRRGPRPVLQLHAESPPEDHAWAMMDAMRELADLGGAQDAREVRHLHSVS